jgi:hypothetical protein
LHFHEYRRRDAPSLSAGISATKTAEQIARDLTRRFLPDAEEAIAQTRATWDRELERRDAVGFAIDTLRAAYPRLQEPHLNDWDREKGKRGELGAWGAPYIKAKASHYDGRTTVHLELSDLPLETAAAVLALVPNREEVPEPEEEPADVMSDRQSLSVEDSPSNCSGCRFRDRMINQNRMPVKLSYSTHYETYKTLQ